MEGVACLLEPPRQRAARCEELLANICTRLGRRLEEPESAFAAGNAKLLFLTKKIIEYYGALFVVFGLDSEVHCLKIL